VGRKTFQGGSIQGEEKPRALKHHSRRESFKGGGKPRLVQKVAKKGIREGNDGAVGPEREVKRSKAKWRLNEQYSVREDSSLDHNLKKGGEKPRGLKLPSKRNDGS